MQNQRSPHPNIFVYIRQGRADAESNPVIPKCLHFVSFVQQPEIGAAK